MREKNLFFETEQASNTVPSSWGGHSNRIAAVNLEGKPQPAAIDDLGHTTNQKPGWKKFLSFVGPSFLVSLAYLDPVETDLQAAADPMDMKGKKTEVGGSQGAGPLIIIVSVLVMSWILGLDIIGINAYYLSTSFVGWLLNNNSISFGQMLPYCLSALGFIVMGRRPLLFIIF